MLNSEGYHETLIDKIGVKRFKNALWSTNNIVSCASQCTICGQGQGQGHFSIVGKFHDGKFEMTCQTTYRSRGKYINYCCQGNLKHDTAIING